MEGFLSSSELSVYAAIGKGVVKTLYVRGRHTYKFFSCPVKDIIMCVAFSVIEVLKQLSEVVVVWLLKEV